MMKMKRLTGIAILLLLLGAGMASAQEVKVIVNADNPVTALSVEQLRALYLGQTREFADGQRVEPVEPADSETLNREFCESYLDRSLRQLKAHWAQMIFSGKGRPPRRLNAPALVEYIGSNPGAIGYVSSSLELGPRVKVVQITE